MPSTTASMVAPAATTAGPRNPKDSMKSTWRAGSRSQWSIFHWSYVLLGICPDYLDKKPPVHKRSDIVPHVPAWKTHRWVLFHASLPVLLHQLYVSYFQTALSSTAMVAYYSFAFILIGIHQIHVLRKIGYTHGFLDGDEHARDGIPDVGVVSIFFSLTATVVLRIIMTVVLAYDSAITPAKMDWYSLPVELFLYGVVLDFWFYWYHRIMHQFDGFWKYHRTHHLTKHPNTLLSLYADNEQEFFDIIVIPLMTYLSLKAVGLPMGFYEWWICHQYVVFVELTGHSGLRIHAETTSPITPFLKLFDCELIIEDHDLHHRKGWRKSYNYGKQTRLWDRVFGTCLDRIECVKGNIDYENLADFPLFY